MIHDIPKPKISPAFTVDDIHKLREWEYERLKDATPEECRADTERRTKEAYKRLGIVNGKYEPAHKRSTLTTSKIQ
jgi:hypothetical protein